MFYVLWPCLIWFSLLSVSSELSPNEVSVPKSIRVNESAELHCAYSLDGEDPAEAIVKWWFKPHNKETQLQLYQRIGDHVNILSKYITANSSDDSIVILSAQPEHSGVYECEVNLDFDEHRQSAEMTVYTLGSGVELNVTEVVQDEEPSRLAVFKCSAQDVAPAPTLIITVNGENTNASVEVSSDEGVFDVWASAAVAGDALAGAAVRCQLAYDQPAIDLSEQVNAFQEITYQPDATTTDSELNLINTTETPLQSADTTGDDGHQISSNAVMLLAALMALLAAV